MASLRVLVLGISGLLGHTVGAVWRKNGSYAEGTIRTENKSDWSGFANKIHVGIDIGSCHGLARLKAVLETGKFDFAINCIGAVKQKISDSGILEVCNSWFPRILSRMCEESGCKLIQISSDCVFSGNTGEYTVSQVPDPVDMYGITKANGENISQGHLVIRTSFIGWEAQRPFAGLLEWFSAQHGNISGYENVYWSGVTARQLANSLHDIVATVPGLSGVHHIASSRISKSALLVLLKKHLGSRVSITPVDRGFCDRSLIMDETTKRATRIPELETLIEGLAIERFQ